MHIPDTTSSIITHGLFSNFDYSSVLLILLAPIHSTKPAGLYSQHRQPSLMAIHPQLPSSFAIQTPGVGHQNRISFTHGVPLGGSRRSSRHSQGRGVFSQNIFIATELHATGRSSDGAFLA